MEEWENVNDLSNTVNNLMRRVDHLKTHVTKNTKKIQDISVQVSEASKGLTNNPPINNDNQITGLDN